MTWLTEESGVESSQPREGIEIRYGLVRELIATGSRDIEIAGNRYRAFAAERSEVKVATAEGSAELQLQLPVKHAFAQRYIASPPDDISVVVRRLQLTSGEVEQYWSGSIAAMNVANHVAVFQCETMLSLAMRRRVPSIGCSRQCVHNLYDKNCRVSRAGNSIPTTVVSHSGRDVVLSSVGGNISGWARFGELLHVPSGQRMAVIDQVGTSIKLFRPIYGLTDLDAVVISAGCAHDIGTCDTKFSNSENFGGLPQLPRGNVFLFGGYGIYQPKPSE